MAIAMAIAKVNAEKAKDKGKEKAENKIKQLIYVSVNFKNDKKILYSILISLGVRIGLFLMDNFRSKKSYGLKFEVTQMSH